MSWRYIPELLATPVPRYTSYPTAAEFHESVGAAEMHAALAEVTDDEPITLYLHIPYCHEICWYCGCNTGAANKTKRLDSYLEALRDEIDLIAALLAGRGRVTRISFGGGSPNAITPQAFLQLVAQLRSRFRGEGATISVELDPRTLDTGFIGALGAAGVTHASLGVQTFEPAVQQAIGRIQPAAMVADVVRKLRAAGVRSLNFDLMYGLPQQGLAELQSTLDLALGLRPDRVALFGYAHVPHLIPRQRRIDGDALADAETRFAQAALGHVRLTGAGYRAVGFDHFALPADPLAAAAEKKTVRRNFQGFTDDPNETVIGFGASAISRFPGALIQNEKNAGRYRTLLSEGQVPAARGIVRSAEDRSRGAVIEAILCHGEARIEDPLAWEARMRLAEFEQHGLIGWEGHTLRLQPDALPYARTIAARFDAYRDTAPTRFSNAI